MKILIVLTGFLPDNKYGGPPISVDNFCSLMKEDECYIVTRNHVKDERPAHVKLMQRLPKEDYDAMVGSCDVGMIFLDHRFTIPNFPSRLLS